MTRAGRPARPLRRLLAAAALVAMAASSALGQATGLGRGIAEIARVYNLEPALVAAIISVESDFNPRAVSGKGARGMMQLMPATARELGVANLHDPWENIEGGARYFREKLDRFDGNVRLALAAYNAGEGAVRQHRGIPPYPETIGFVNEVLARYEALKARGLPSAGARPVPAAPREVAPAPAPALPPPAPERAPETRSGIVVEVEEMAPSARAIAHLRDGARLAREGQLARAIEHYRAARTLAPLSPEPANQLGLAYLRLGRFEDAQAEFEAALRLAPGAASFLNNLGLALHMRGEFRRAVSVLRRAWEAEPARMESGVNLALVLRHLGRRDEARAVLGEVLRARDAVAEAHLNLGHLLEEDGHRGAAARHYERFLELTEGQDSSLRDQVRERVTALRAP